MRRYRIEIGGRTHVVDVQEVTATEFRVNVGGQALDVTLSAAEDVAETVISPGISPAGEDDRPVSAASTSAAAFKPAAPDTLKPMVPAAPPPLPPAQPERGASGALKAPMPGTITAVQTRPGDTVVAGQVLLKLEAMKMVNAIKASRGGVVAAVHVQPGQSVGYGHVLVTFKEA